MGLRELTYPTRRRPVLWALTAISLALAIGGSIFVVKQGADDAKIDLGPTTTTVTTVAGFDPGAASNATLPTVTTAPTVVPPEPENTTTIPERVRSFEGEFATSEDIARLYPPSSSQLQQSIYERATTTGVAALTARVTGDGASAYQDYINAEASMPKVVDLTIDGVFADISRIDRAYVRVVVWWHGNNVIGNRPIRQGTTSIFLAPGTLEPVPQGRLPEALKSDPLLDTVYVGG